MDLDDEQVLRHSTREIASFLAVVYEELRAAGLPKRVAESITIAQWTAAVSTGQAEELARKLLEGIGE